jgi:hypothetical protein
MNIFWISFLEKENLDTVQEGLQDLALPYKRLGIKTKKLSV